MNAEDHLEKARIKRDQLKGEEKKKAVITALALVSVTLISLVFLFYAFQQKERAAKLEQELIQTKSELELCKKQ